MKVSLLLNASLLLLSLNSFAQTDRGDGHGNGKSLSIEHENCRMNGVFYDTENYEEILRTKGYVLYTGLQEPHTLNLHTLAGFKSYDQNCQSNACLTQNEKLTEYIYYTAIRNFDGRIIVKIKETIQGCPDSFDNDRVTTFINRVINKLPDCEIK